MTLFNVPAELVQVVVFGACALAAVIASFAVVLARDPFTSALSLLGTFTALGGLYILLHAPYVAMAQVLVYSGAVVVMFLFVMAYLGDRRELATGSELRMAWTRSLGALFAALVCFTLVAVIVDTRFPAAADVGSAFGSVQQVGVEFLTKWPLEFEVTSLVLIVAAAGGVVLGLTGRHRQTRLRKALQTRSSEQQKRWLRAGGAAAETTAPRSDVNGHAAGGSEKTLAGVDGE